MLFYGTVREISELLAGRNEEIELDRAALMLARIEFPDLDVNSFLLLLDSYAVELAGRLGEHHDGAEFVARANHYLFKELGFNGNETDYYNPSNSCLNEVLTKRVGIPITLSVVYLEIARRLAKPMFGVGLPGHFVIQYDDGVYATYIDPFHRGRLLDAAECLELARGAAETTPERPVLARVGKRHIIGRMINNLRGIYFSRRAHRKALQVLNLLIDANPQSAGEYKQRGTVYLQLDQIRPAKADLERYLELAPEASDKADIEKQLRSLKRWLVGMN